MSWMNLLTSPILITSLTFSVLASFTSIANARPESWPVTPNTQISGHHEVTGNILKGEPTTENIFASELL